MQHYIRASYDGDRGKTSVRSVYETGSLRLRHPRDTACKALIVNTGGGIIGGDVASIEIDVSDFAQVSVSSVAAEKVYRSEGTASRIVTSLKMTGAARLAWLPQETILYNRARLERKFCVDVAADAIFLACEILQFGRPAFGETSTQGFLRESWRIRRAGRLIHADESRIDGPIGATLDRRTVADGARAIANLLHVAPKLDGCAERLEATLAPFRSRHPLLEGGVSAKDGIVLARLSARSATDLRPCIGALIESCPGFPLPRVWR